MMEVQKVKFNHFIFLLSLFFAPFIGFTANFTLESPVFQQQELIPQNYTCDGQDIPPPLLWKNAPSRTQSFVLIVDDLDAPNGTWIHWLVFNLPSTLSKLDEHQSLPKQALVGLNSWGQHKYGGPCPPRGVHRYRFRLYALDTRLRVNSSVNQSDILNAMEGHILAEASLWGIYGTRSGYSRLSGSS